MTPDSPSPAVTPEPAIAPPNPRRRTSLAKDASSQVIIQFLLKVAAGATSILLVNHLNEHNNGLLNIAWGFVNFAGYLTDLGFNAILVREAANASEERRRHLVWTSFRSRIGLSLAVVVIALLGSFAVQDPELVLLLRGMVVPILVSNVLFTWTEGVMIATERVSLAARYALIWTLGNVVATLLTLVTNQGLMGYALLQLVCTWTVGLFSVSWVLRQYPYSTQHDNSVYKGLAAFGAAGFLTSIVDRIPTFALIPLLGVTIAQNGAYGAGNKIPAVLIVLPFGIAKAFFTRMCQAWETDLERHKALVLTSIRTGSLLGSLVALGLCVTAPELVGLFWGEKSGPWQEVATLTLALTGCIPWLQTMSLPLGDALASSAQYALRTRILAVYAVVAALTFVAAILWGGVHGAAVAAVLIEAFLLGAYLFVARPGLRGQAAALITGRVLMLAVALAVAFLLKPYVHLGLWPLADATLAAAVGVAAYLGAVLLFDTDVRTLVNSRLFKRAT